MSRGIKWLCALCSALFLLFLLLRRLHPGSAVLALAIAFGTTTYHLAMRLAVGWLFDRLMGNRADLTRAWYRPRAWEESLYRRLRVKEWKKHLPAYDPSRFDPGQRTWGEIAQAMCQAELVHESIALLSFLPLALIPSFGTAAVFWFTSLAGALFDLAFAATQRYNRPRVVRLMEKRPAVTSFVTAGRFKDSDY